MVPSGLPTLTGFSALWCPNHWTSIRLARAKNAGILPHGWAGKGVQTLTLTYTVRGRLTLTPIQHIHLYSLTHMKFSDQAP